MDAPRRPTALITGASSGIGFELAKLFAASHYDLILVSRSEDALNEIAEDLASKQGISCMVIAADLADPKAPETVWQMVEEAGLEVDILVNNAGFGLYGSFHETELERELDMIQLNIATLTELTKRALPGMLKRKRGRILNVASTAAFQPGPLMAVYYATKAYVLSFSEAIGEELAASGITVTALCPGPTESNFQVTANMGSSNMIKSWELPPATKVALAGFRGLMRGRRIVVPGFRNKVGIQAVRFTPRRVVTRIVQRLQRSIDE